VEVTASPDVARETWDLQLTGIKKAFGPVVALAGADLNIRYGEVHALLGENGAGKSTLLKVLTGVTRPDSGHIRLEGQELHFRHVADTMRAGIGTVFQELSLIPDLSVAANLFFLHEDLSRLGTISQRNLQRRAEELFEHLGLEGIPVDVPAGTLPIAQQQLVEIAKVLGRHPRILLLDEATSSLPLEDTEWLFRTVRSLTAEGTAVVFISHRMQEVMELADRISVLRNGVTVAAGPRATFTEDSLVEHMLGQRLLAQFPEQLAPPTDKVVLRVKDLRVGRALHDVNLEVREGEILGIAGLQGQGQMSLLLSLYGWAHAHGTIEVDGHPVRLHSPRDGLRHGIALVPEDRRTEGLLLDQSVRENLTLPLLTQLRNMVGFLPMSRERAAAWDVVDRLHVRTASIEQEVGTLSGGNQQKVLLGKMLATKVRVLLLADITRGVDVGAKADFYKLIQRLAAEGKAIIFYSTDSLELVSFCHRVAVMYDHTVFAVLSGSELTEENLIRAYMGGRSQPNKE